MVTASSNWSSLGRFTVRLMALMNIPSVSIETSGCLMRIQPNLYAGSSRPRMVTPASLTG
jgi:hypothetical protein